jgi:CheY-like chemotaxis protein
VLSNAFKYTEQGVITLSVFAETADKESETTLVFLVSDTGQGMTEEQLSRLFDEYSRFNMRTNRTIEGTGLGMSITRNLVRMMHGEILVQSEPGRGSTFTVRLPQGNAGAGVLGRELVESLRQFRITSTTQMKRTQITREPMPYGSILVVDDVEANIYVARGLLAPYGLTIDSAESGFAAIEKIEQGAAYDIVFMDHMMPEMDGIEATKIMRDLGYTNPIIALTANSVTRQAEIFLEKGFDDFIAKPSDIRQMNILLNKFVRDRHPPEVVEAARLQKSDSHEYAGDIMPPLAADPKLAKIFIRDASKSIAVLETLPKEHGAYSDENVQTYVISVHGMKSALANIGESELSALAYKLEQAGREKNIAVMVSETPIFLKALQEVIKKITPREDDEVKEATEENSAYLREKLLVLKAACAAYDKKAAKDTLAEIGQKAWPRPTRALLETIAEHLLHSKFKEIVSTVDTSDCL